MESRRGDTDALGRATELLVERAKVYKHGRKKKYRQIQVFSRDHRDVRVLKKVFGGNYYRHGVGFTWVVSRKEEVDRLLEIKEESV